MKTIIALHGNPGAPQDWDILRGRLDSKNFELKAFDSYDGRWIEAITQGLGKKIILTHSWGGYCVLKNLKKIAPYIERVILVCPYLKPEKKLSAVACLLLELPVIGSILIKASHKKAKEHFVPDMIYPLRLEQLPYFQEIQNRLEDWQIWQKAALTKIQMQRQAWNNTDLVDIPLDVLYGEQDKTSRPAVQNEILNQYPHTTTQMIPGAGHGLLWSHPEIIIASLEGAFP